MIYFLIIIGIGALVLNLIISNNKQIRKEDKSDIDY